MVVKSNDLFANGYNILDVGGDEHITLDLR